MKRLPSARIAVGAGFFLSGAGFASWVVRIPALQEGLALSEGTLGLALLGVSLGALVAMPLAGAAIVRFGSRPVARLAMFGAAAAISLPPLANDAASLALALAAIGAASSVMNVALNTQAAGIQRRLGRPIMAGLHALFSLGGLVGAAVGGLVAGAGVGVGPHLGLGGLLIATLTLVVGRALLRSGDGSGNGGAAAGPAFALPTRPLLVLGAIAFCVLFGEGAVANWSAIYLRDAVGAGAGLAATGFAAFSLMMAAGRFAGDALTVRLGPMRLVRLGAVTAAAGILLVLAVPSVWSAVLGFAAVGAGLAAIFPTLLSAAARVAGINPANSIATVSTIGYLGLMAGPPAIGFAAEATSVRVAIGLIAITSLLIVFGAGVLPRAALLRRGTPGRPSAPLGPRLREA